MKSEKAIIYDDTCPMCCLYTEAFVKVDLLKKDNRVSFSELANKKEFVDQLDFDKSRHEIPLVDVNGGETLYGMDSLVYILSQKFPILERFMNIGPIHFFFKKLYKLVSYNRRVIVPSKKVKQEFDCTPDFNLKYRLIYIGGAFFTGLFLTSLLLMKVFGLVVIPIILAAMTLLVGIGFLKADFREMQTRTEYFGQLATAVLIGGLVSIPGFIFPQIYFVFAGIGLVLMSREYFRRMKLIDQNISFLKNSF